MLSVAYTRVAPTPALYGSRNYSQTDPSRFASTLATILRLDGEKGAEAADPDLEGPRLRLKAALTVVPRHGGPAPEVDNLPVHGGKAPRDGKDRRGQRLWRYGSVWERLDADGRDRAERDLEVRWCREVLDDETKARQVEARHGKSLALQAAQLIEHARLQEEETPQMHLREVMMMRDMAASLEKMHAAQTMRPQHVAPVAPIPLREQSAPIVEAIGDAQVAARLEAELNEQTRDHLGKHATYFDKRTVDPVKNRGLKNKKGGGRPSESVGKKAMLPNALRRFVQNVLYGTGNVVPLLDPLPGPCAGALKSTGPAWDVDLHEPILTATQVTIPLGFASAARPGDSAAAYQNQLPLPVPASAQPTRPLHLEEIPPLAQRSLPRGLKPKRKQHTTAGPGGASSRISERGITGVEWADPNDDPSKLGLDAFVSLVHQIMQLPEDGEADPDAMDVDQTGEGPATTLASELHNTAFQVQCTLEKRASKGILPPDGDIHQIYSDASGVSAWANVHVPHRDAPDGIAPILQVAGPGAPEGVSINDARTFVNSLASDTINKLAIASLTHAWRQSYERDTLENTLNADSDPDLLADIRTALAQGQLRDTRGGLSDEAGQFTATRPALRDTPDQRQRALERARELANQEQLPALIALMKRMDERACARGQVCYDNHLQKAAEILPDSMHPEREILDRSWVHQHGFLVGYLARELRAMGSRPCKNAFTGNCVAIEISRRTRGRIEYSQVSRYAPDLVFLRDAASGTESDGVFSLLRPTTDQLYFDQPSAEVSEDSVFLMREFLTPKELQSSLDWIRWAQEDPDFAQTHGDPLHALPQTCLLCEIQSVCVAASKFNSGQIRAQDSPYNHPERRDLLVPLARWEWRTGPGQYAPSAMWPNAFFSKDQDNSHLPGRPTIIGKSLAHVLHHYQLRSMANTEVVGMPGVTLNRPVLMETDTLDFRPVLSNINASFAGLPKWGWGTVSALSLPALPRVSDEYQRNRIIVVPLKAYESASPFELFQNEQQAWYYHLGRTGSWNPEESPVSSNWWFRYGSHLRDATRTRVPSWSTFLLACPVGLHDGAWFARVLKAERFSRFDTWYQDQSRVLDWGGAGPARTVICENLENLPLVLLRRFFLLRGRLALLLYFEDNGLVLNAGRDSVPNPAERGADPDEFTEACYLHQMYNPTCWDVHRMEVPEDYARDPEVMARLAEERVRWEVLLAPTISTLRYMEGKVATMQARLGPGWRERQLWVHDSRRDTWRYGQDAMRYEELLDLGYVPEMVPLQDLFYQTQTALPLSLHEAAKERLSRADLAQDSSHRADMIDLVNLAAEGFSLLSVCLFKLYHLHRLQSMAMEYKDACLLSATRGFLAELIPFFVTCVAHNAWSDAAWFDPGAVRLPRKITIDPVESAVAPNARLYARGFRVPKEVGFALRTCSLAQIQWPGLRASRVSLHDAPDTTIASAHIGTNTNMPGEYTSTQDSSRPYPALILAWRKCDPLKSQKREERSIAHRLMAKFPGQMEITQNGLHLMLDGRLPFIFEPPTFFASCCIWTGLKSMRTKLKRTYPEDGPLETTIRIRTWLVKCMLYEPMPDKHLKKKRASGKTPETKPDDDLTQWLLTGAYFRYHNRWFVQWMMGFGQRQTTIGPIMRAHPHQGIMLKTQQMIVRTALRGHASRIQYVPIVFPTQNRLKYRAQLLQQAVVMHAQHAMQTRLHGAMNKQLRIVVQKAPFWELLLEILNKFYNSIISKVIQSLRPMLMPLTQRGSETGEEKAKGRPGQRKAGTVNGKPKGPVPKAKTQSEGPASQQAAVAADPPNDPPVGQTENEGDGDQGGDSDAFFGAAPRVVDLDTLLNELHAVANSAMAGDFGGDAHSFANMTAFDNVWDQFREDPILDELRHATLEKAIPVPMGPTQTQTQAPSPSQRPGPTASQPAVTLFDPNRPVHQAPSSGFNPERASFDHTQTPPTALHCYTLVEIQRILRMFISQLLRVPALDDPGREEVHETFKRIAHRMTIYRSFQQELPKTFLGYFGVPERVMQLLSSIYYQYIHGAPHYGIETTIHKMWFDYRDQLATIWRLLRYMATFASYRKIVLPRHVAEHQKRALLARHAHLHPLQVPIFAQSVQETRMENYAHGGAHNPEAQPVQPMIDIDQLMEVEELPGLGAFNEADIFAGLQDLPDHLGLDQAAADGIKRDLGV